MYVCFQINLLGSFRIRYSTYERLALLRDGALSTVLRHILSRDPIVPVLWEPYYAALDRRLSNVLSVIAKCIEEHGQNAVLIPDDVCVLQRAHWFDVYWGAFMNTFQTRLMDDAYNEQLYDIVDVLSRFVTVCWLICWLVGSLRASGYQLYTVQDAVQRFRTKLVS